MEGWPRRFPPGRTGCARGHAGGACGRAASAAVRADTELFLERRAESNRWSGSHQVGGPWEPSVSGSLLASIVPAYAIRNAQPAKPCVLFCAAHPFLAARGTDEAVRPAHDQPGGAGVIVREHVLRRRLSGLFHAPSAGTYSEHSTRSPESQPQHLVANSRDRSHV